MNPFEQKFKSSLDFSNRPTYTTPAQSQEFKTPPIIQTADVINIKKSTVVEEESKETVNTNIPEEELKLTSTDLLMMELLKARKIAADKDVEAITSKIENYNLMSKNLELRIYQIRKDVEMLQSNAEEKKKAQERLDSDVKEFFVILGKKYNMSENWNYDPNSGKIV